MEDSRIIDLYWERDQRAIGETDAKYGGYCASVMQPLLDCPEDVDECLNDTWLAAWNRMPPQRPAVLRMFLAKIARRIAINRLKAEKAQKRGGGELPLVLEELAECIPAGESAEQEVMTRELGSCISRFVRSLPEREGDIFCRRYFFTESVPRIAAYYCLSPNHVSVILNRTRKRLEKYLAEEGYLT